MSLGCAERAPNDESEHRLIPIGLSRLPGLCENHNLSAQLPLRFIWCSLIVNEPVPGVRELRILFYDAILPAIPRCRYQCPHQPYKTARADGAHHSRVPPKAV